VLSAKQGDQQSRAELLGHMLNAAGFQSFMVRHGTGRNVYHLIVLRLDEEASQVLARALDRSLAPVRIGPATVVTLPLEPDAEIGTVGASYYDADTGRWTASIAFRRLR
jgi:hypothetical protein